MEKRVESKSRLRAKNPKTTTGGEKLEKENAVIDIYIHNVPMTTFLKLSGTFPEGTLAESGDWFSCQFPNSVEITWYRER